MLCSPKHPQPRKALIWWLILYWQKCQLTATPLAPQIHMLLASKQLSLGLCPMKKLQQQWDCAPLSLCTPICTQPEASKELKATEEGAAILTGQEWMEFQSMASLSCYKNSATCSRTLLKQHGCLASAVGEVLSVVLSPPFELSPRCWLSPCPD